MPMSGQAVYELNRRMKEHHNLVQHELYGDNRGGLIPPDDLLPAIIRASESLNEMYAILKREAGMTHGDFVEAQKRIAG